MSTALPEWQTIQPAQAPSFKELPTTAQRTKATDDTTILDLSPELQLAYDLLDIFEQNRSLDESHPDSLWPALLRIVDFYDRTQGKIWHRQLSAQLATIVSIRREMVRLNAAIIPVDVTQLHTAADFYKALDADARNTLTVELFFNAEERFIHEELAISGILAGFLQSVDASHWRITFADPEMPDTTVTDEEVPSFIREAPLENEADFQQLQATIWERLRQKLDQQSKIDRRLDKKLSSGPKIVWSVNERGERVGTVVADDESPRTLDVKHPGQPLDVSSSSVVPYEGSRRRILEPTSVLDLLTAQARDQAAQRDLEREREKTHLMREQALIQQQLALGRQMEKFEEKKAQFEEKKTEVKKKSKSMQSSCCVPTLGQGAAGLIILGVGGWYFGRGVTEGILRVEGVTQIDWLSEWFGYQWRSTHPAATATMRAKAYAAHHIPEFFVTLDEDAIVDKKRYSLRYQDIQSSWSDYTGKYAKQPDKLMAGAERCGRAVEIMKLEKSATDLLTNVRFLDAVRNTRFGVSKKAEYFDYDVWPGARGTREGRDPKSIQIASDLRNKFREFSKVPIDNLTKDKFEKDRKELNGLIESLKESFETEVSRIWQVDWLRLSIADTVDQLTVEQQRTIGYGETTRQSMVDYIENQERIVALEANKDRTDAQTKELLLLKNKAIAYAEEQAEISRQKTALLECGRKIDGFIANQSRFTAMVMVPVPVETPFKQSTDDCRIFYDITTEELGSPPVTSAMAEIQPGLRVVPPKSTVTTTKSSTELAQPGTAAPQFRTDVTLNVYTPITADFWVKQLFYVVGSYDDPDVMERVLGLPKGQFFGAVQVADEPVSTSKTALSTGTPRAEGFITQHSRVLPGLLQGFGQGFVRPIGDLTPAAQASATPIGEPSQPRILAAATTSSTGTTVPALGVPQYARESRVVGVVGEPGEAGVAVLETVVEKPLVVPDLANTNVGLGSALLESSERGEQLLLGPTAEFDAFSAVYAPALLATLLELPEVVHEVLLSRLGVRMANLSRRTPPAEEPKTLDEASFQYLHFYFGAENKPNSSRPIPVDKQNAVRRCLTRVSAMGCMVTAAGWRFLAGNCANIRRSAMVAFSINTLWKFGPLVAATAATAKFAVVFGVIALAGVIVSVVFRRQLKSAGPGLRYVVTVLIPRALQCFAVHFYLRQDASRGQEHLPQVASSVVSLLMAAAVAVQYMMREHRDMPISFKIRGDSKAEDQFVTTTVAYLDKKSTEIRKDASRIHRELFRSRESKEENPPSILQTTVTAAASVFGMGHSVFRNLEYANRTPQYAKAVELQNARRSALRQIGTFLHS